MDVAKVNAGQLFACPEHNPIHGEKESIQDDPHRALRHGLCYLHSLSPGEEPVWRLLCTGPEVQ
jgi:hypothetical protein